MIEGGNRFGESTFITHMHIHAEGHTVLSSNVISMYLISG